MPLRHTKSGWMWGSKGPFPTKAKALQVARAAFANGYKEHDITGISGLYTPSRMDLCENNAKIPALLRCSGKLQK